MATQQTEPQAKQDQQSESKREGGTPQGSVARRASFPIRLVTPADLFRMNPFSLMRRMTEEMDRVFGDGGQERETSAVFWAPPIEVSEREGNYMVRAELPGIKPEDVSLEVENDALVLQGERKDEREEDKGGVHRTEIRYGLFYRSIPLPEGANVEQVRAKFDNGVLEVTVPMPKQAGQRKQIPIQGSSNASQTAT